MTEPYKNRPFATPTSLAELFNWASHDLVQITGSYGTCNGTKQACAEGAVCYYRFRNNKKNSVLRKDAFDDPFDETESLEKKEKVMVLAGADFLADDVEPELAEKFYDFQNDLFILMDCSVVHLNDKEGWTFQDFSRVAKELGY